MIEGFSMITTQMVGWQEGKMIGQYYYIPPSNTKMKTESLAQHEFSRINIQEGVGGGVGGGGGLPALRCGASRGENIGQIVRVSYEQIMLANLIWMPGWVLDSSWENIYN